MVQQIWVRNPFFRLPTQQSFPGLRLQRASISIPPGLSVTPTKQYVAVFGFGMNPPGAGDIVVMSVAGGGDKYSGGGAFTDGSLQPVYGWEPDLMFEAEFSVSPEPSTWVLLGSGLIGLGAVAWRRKKQA